MRIVVVVTCFVCLRSTVVASSDRIAERWAALCPEVLRDGVAAGFGEIDVEALPESANVRVCHPRDVERKWPGILVVEDLLSPQELESYRRVAHYLERVKSVHHCMLSSVLDVTRTVEERLERVFGINHTRNRASSKLQCFTTVNVSPKDVNRNLSAAALAKCARFPNVNLEKSATSPGSHVWPRLPCRMHDLDLHVDVGFFSTPWVTVLLYLEDTTLGGHTIFPMLRPSASRKRPSLDRLRLEGAMRDDMRKRPARFGGRRRSYAASIMCADLALADTTNETYRHFGIPPRAGSAIAFYHFVEERSASGRRHAVPDSALYWHAGCPVLSGRKIHMQSFREPDVEFYQARGADAFYRGSNEFRAGACVGACLSGLIGESGAL